MKSDETVEREEEHEKEPMICCVEGLMMGIRLLRAGAFQSPSMNN